MRVRCVVVWARPLFVSQANRTVIDVHGVPLSKDAARLLKRNKNWASWLKNNPVTQAEWNLFNGHFEHLSPLPTHLTIHEDVVGELQGSQLPSGVVFLDVSKCARLKVDLIGVAGVLSDEADFRAWGCLSVVSKREYNDLAQIDRNYVNSVRARLLGRKAVNLLAFLRPFGRLQVPDTIPLIVLGDGLVGKTTLLLNLQGCMEWGLATGTQHALPFILYACTCITCALISAKPY